MAPFLLLKKSLQIAKKVAKKFGSLKKRCYLCNTIKGLRLPPRPGSQSKREKKMKAYRGNFTDLAKLQETGTVVVALSNAEYFLRTCQMAGLRVKFEQYNGQIKFSL